MDRFFLSKDNAALVITDIQDRLAAVMKVREDVIKNCLHLIELAKMLNIPICVLQTCTETVLFQLLKVAGTEEFKAISKRIK